MDLTDSSCVVLDFDCSESLFSSLSLEDQVNDVHPSAETVAADSLDSTVVINFEHSVVEPGFDATSSSDDVVLDFNSFLTSTPRKGYVQPVLSALSPMKPPAASVTATRTPKSNLSKKDQSK